MFRQHHKVLDRIEQKLGKHQAVCIDSSSISLCHLQSVYRT